jgi:hypothetical protein
VRILQISSRINLNTSPTRHGDAVGTVKFEYLVRFYAHVILQ